MRKGLVTANAYFWRKQINMIDVTDLIINNLRHEQGMNPLCINFNHEGTDLTMLGLVEITDNRVFKDPPYDSPDGLPTYVRGEVDLDIDIAVIDEESKEFEFKFDRDLILEDLG